MIKEISHIVYNSPILTRCEKERVRVDKVPGALVRADPDLQYDQLNLHPHHGMGCEPE
jgi:hypothetical protein